MAGMELTLSFDNFNRPLIKEDADADCLKILRCLTRTKDNPVGGNVEFNISKYRFSDIDQMQSTLASDIRNHINRVLPYVLLDDVDVMKLSEKQLGLVITITGETERSKKRYLFTLEKNEKDSIIIKNLKDITNI